MSWTVFPRIYTNLQSKVYFQFCFQVRRPVISTIVDHICHFMRNKKSLPKYLIHENSKYQHFLFLKKQPPKLTNFSTFYLIFKGPPFQYHKVRHLNFLWYTTSWNLFLKFELKKGSFLWTFWQKCREKHYKWDIEKNGIAYSTARNFKTASLWNFHFH